MKFFYTTLLVYILLLYRFADAVSISAVPKKPVPGVITIAVTVDPEGEILNTFSGELNYPEDIITVEHISTIDSIASIWLTRPQIQNEKIIWAGFTPGGFDGVKGALFDGTQPGVLFTVTFKVLVEGPIGFDFTNLEFRKHDSSATPVTVASKTISVPSVAATEETIIPNVVAPSQQFINTALFQDTFSNNAWFVAFSVDTNRVSIDRFEVAESKKLITEDVAARLWRTSESPVQLKHQSRNRYVHIKAVATDGTVYTTTLAPDIHAYSTHTKNILWGILVVFLVVLVMRRRART